jgi:hypothetical protein
LRNVRGDEHRALVGLIDFLIVLAHSLDYVSGLSEVFSENK